MPCIPQKAFAWGKEEKVAVTIHMSEEGRIYVGETYTGLKGLVAYLKRKKYPKSARITIEIPQNASDNAIQQIAQALATAGYFSMRFKKPQIADSTKDPLPPVR
jgi:biopolymer transport protein ExbD